ncbi:hypothetical protein VIOR103205_14385 [Vibrio ordalii]|uniref:hypothetical protein n=1 Tax=Vibrio ordalii TaxID=28174 RepID=UPI000248371C|nr:hypothetical protein [Vibrio ordalii]
MTDRTELSSTEKQLREALKRLIDKQPTHRELKRKLSANKLKIVVANVEKEAGLSNGAAKRYPETKKMIEGAEAERIHGSSDVSGEVVRAHPIYIKAREEVKKLKAELEQKDGRLAHYKELLKSQAARMHQMNVAMWNNIPEENKHVEVIIDVQDMGSQDNILAFKKREKLN